MTQSIQDNLDEVVIVPQGELGARLVTLIDLDGQIRLPMSNPLLQRLGSALERRFVDSRISALITVSKVRDAFDDAERPDTEVLTQLEEHTRLHIQADSVAINLHPNPLKNLHRIAPDRRAADEIAIMVQRASRMRGPGLEVASQALGNGIVGPEDVLAVPDLPLPFLVVDSPLAQDDMLEPDALLIRSPRLTRVLLPVARAHTRVDRVLRPQHMEQDTGVRREGLDALAQARRDVVFHCLAVGLERAQVEDVVVVDFGDLLPAEPVAEALE